MNEYVIGGAIGFSLLVWTLFRLTKTGAAPDRTRGDVLAVSDCYICWGCLRAGRSLCDVLTEDTKCYLHGRPGAAPERTGAVTVSIQSRDDG